jgi:hypothetical protein
MPGGAKPDNLLQEVIHAIKVSPMLPGLPVHVVQRGNHHQVCFACVAPGAAMPPVAGCARQDYAVLFVIAVGVTDSI